MTEPRLAQRQDIPAIAKIVVDWERGKNWLPEPPPSDVIAGYIDAAFDARRIWVIGTPVRAYASFNPETQQLGAIYCASPGNGDGKMLMDIVKDGQDTVWLTTHEPNTAAHRFYAREGFRHTETLPGTEPHEDVPLFKMEWQR